ncbi:hypothetical protein JCM8115_001598, partial [Rhodotorula mucilaginosa]
SVIAPLLVDGPWTVLREIEREALDALRARNEREATLKQADMDNGSRLLAVINARLDESAFPHPPLKREGVVFSTIKACEETRAFLLHLVDKPFVEPPSTPATPIVTGDPLNDRDAPANELSESSDGLARFYARFVTFESLKHALEFMRHYASDHYANLAWASTIISGLLSLKAKELGHASDVALSYARGGRRLEVVESAFSPRQHAFLAAAGARQEDLDRLALPERSPTDTQQQIQHAVRHHFDDMLTFWQSEVDPSEAGKTIDVGTEGGRRAFAAIKQAATSFLQRGVLAPEEDASTDVFVVGKDVTRSSLVGREAFFGPRASRGGHAGYVIARGVLQEPVDEVLGWIALIAYVDLWSIQLRHKLVRIAIVFVARLLALVKPTILVTHASKLSSIVRRGMIGAAIGTVDTPEQRAFLGVQTRTTRTLLEHVAPPAEHKWKELWAKDWLASVCTLEVVEGPLGVEMLHLDQIDCGFIKYYPAVQDLVIKRSVDQICEDIGLAIKLDKARHRLGQRFGALRSAQSTSAILRSSSVVFDGPPLAEDAIADAVKLLAISSSSPSTSLTAGGSNPAAIDNSDLLSSAPRVAQLVSVRLNQTSLPSDFATMCMLATSNDFARWFLVQAQGESLAVAARSEMRRREQLEIQGRKRQEIGTTIAGAIGIGQCIQRLRKDASNSTQKERFELQIDAYVTCGQWRIHIRDDTKIGIANHDCMGKRKIYYTRILWMATLALLLDLDLDKMASYGVEYDETSAHQHLPSRFRDSALPAAGDPPCILPTNSLPLVKLLQRAYKLNLSTTAQTATTPRAPLAASSQDNIGTQPQSTATASALSRRRASSNGAAAGPIKAQRLASSTSAVHGRPSAEQEQVADRTGAYAGFYLPALIAHANAVRDHVIKGLPTARRHGLAARIGPNSTSQDPTVVAAGLTSGNMNIVPPLTSTSNALRLDENGKVALPARIVAQRRYSLPRPLPLSAGPTSTGSVSAATGPPTEPSLGGHPTASSSATSPVLNTNAAPLKSVITPHLVDGPWTMLRKIEREALDALRARNEREATLKQADMDDGSRLLAVINARLDESAFPHPPLKREGIVFSTIKACEETRAFLLHLVDKPFVEPPSTPATPIVTGDPLNDRDAPANELSESSDGLARFY